MIASDKRIFDVFLQRAAQRTGAIRAIRVLLQNVASRFVRQPDLDLLRHQIHVDLLHQQMNDLQHIFVGQAR